MRFEKKMKGSPYAFGYSLGGCCNKCFINTKDKFDENIDLDFDLDMGNIGSFGKMTHQKVIDNVLHVYFLLPGANKTNINLRTKPDTMIVESLPAEEFKDVLGEKKSTIQIRLKEAIDPEQVSAKFTNGILVVKAPIKNGYEILDIE